MFNVDILSCSNNNIFASQLSFPSDVFKYIKSNATATPKMAVKLMKICKYFQHKEFPFLVIKHVNLRIDEWSYCILDNQWHVEKEMKSIEKFSRNLWITESLDLSEDKHFKTCFFSKIVVCDVKTLNFSSMCITFDQLKFLTSAVNVEELNLVGTRIECYNGDLPDIENILELVPNAKSFKFYCLEENPCYLMAEPIIFSNVIKLLNISILKRFCLCFYLFSDFDVFMNFMKENLQIIFEIYIYGDRSPFEIQILQNFVDKIIEAGVTEHKPPWIEFEGQTWESHMKMASPPSSNFPSDVLKWMKENSKPKTALKLMQICKYFQHQKFPYFIMRQLQENISFGWRYQPLLLERYENLDFESCQNKLWITEELFIFDNHKSKLLLSLLPKIAVCDILILHMNVHNITLEQFKLLTAAGNVKELFLQETIIKNENDEIIPLENIFDGLPNLHKLILSHITNSFYSHENATLNIPSNLQTLQLQDISETFNLEECFKFIQFNQHIQFYLHYFENRFVSNEETRRLQTCTDILIQLWSPENPSPNIFFRYQTTESQEKLKELEKLYKEKIQKK